MKPVAVRNAAVAVFAFFLALYCLTMQGVPVGGDAWGMFLVTESIAGGGGVRLGPSDMAVLAPCGNGEFCARFGVGQSLAQLPLYALGKVLLKGDGARRGALYFITSFTSPVLAAVSCVFVFLLCLRLAYGMRLSLFLTLLYGAGTLVWPSSKALMSEALQTLCVAASVYYVYSYARGGRVSHAVLAGFFCGLLAATKPAMAVALPALLIYLAAVPEKGKRFRGVALFALPVAAWGAAALAYNWLRFGNMFEFGYYMLNDRDSLFRFSVPFWVGLHGLLFSSGKGLFFYVPAMWAACASFPAFLKRHREEALLCLAMFASVCAAYCGWNQWHGDFAWGPRFLAPLMPLVVLSIGAGARATAVWRPALRGAVFAALLAVSVLVQIPGVSARTGAYLNMALTQPPFQIFFRPGDIRLRDNLLNQHYIPEFSPLAAHWWMLKHTIADSGAGRNELNRRMREDFPWRTLMPDAPPPDPAVCAGLDFWFSYMLGYYPHRRAAIVALAAAQAALLAAAWCVLLFFLVREEPCPA